MRGYDWYGEKNMIYYSGLENLVIRNDIDADEFIAISGYIGPSPIARLNDLPYHSEVIFGMYSANGIAESIHNRIVDISNASDRVQVNYSEIAVHSKCYVWMRDNHIVHALIGSANFSASGLRNDFRESLADVDQESYNALERYVGIIRRNLIACNDVNVIANNRGIIRADNIVNCRDSVNLSLLTRGGVPASSGINWGFANANVREGDAYIRIPKDVVLSRPDMFPVRTINPNPFNSQSRWLNNAVELIWDDGVVMEGLLEGSNWLDRNHDVPPAPKQISSYGNKRIMGDYLRRRMGINEVRLVTMDDFERYGRTDINIRLLSEGVYYLDFGVRS